MQFLADILGLPVERPAVTETTALGAAYLAALGAGHLSDAGEIGRRWRCERSFAPAMSEDRRESLLAGWHSAVRRTRSESALVPTFIVP